MFTTVLCSLMLLNVNLSEGLNKGKVENKWIFLYLTSNNCPYCVKMKNETFKDPNTKYVLDQCIFVESNIDQDRSAYDLVQKSFAKTGFNTQLLPSYYIISPHDRTFRIWGYGFKNSPQFLQWLGLTK